LKSVTWAILGSVLFGVLLFIGLFTESLFFTGVAVGWAGCGIFWTYWISRNKEEV